MELGQCRPRAGMDPAKLGCWSFSPDPFGAFTSERCCGEKDSSKLMAFKHAIDIRGGYFSDPHCWGPQGGGRAYEQCCIGRNAATEIQEELAFVGESWYGLSSEPRHPSKDWYKNKCLRAYDRKKFTLSIISK